MSAACRTLACLNVEFRRGYCGKHYREVPHPLAAPKRCAICRVTNSAENRVMTFGLDANLPGNRRRSAGGIRLCEVCWRQHAAPRRKASRPKMAVAS